MRTSLKNAQEPPLSDGRKRSIKKPSGFRVQQPLGGGAGKQGDLAPAVAFAKSQLALMTFAVAFQKHLSAYKRPDNQPMNAKVLLVDPGFCRTPGMNRYLTRGSLWGLAVYIVLWPFWWLTLKSAEQGAQTVLFAAMEASLRVATDDIALLKECRRVSISNLEVLDPIAQETLWKETEKTIEATEAASRNKKKQENLR